MEAVYILLSYAVPIVFLWWLFRLILGKPNKVARPDEGALDLTIPVGDAIDVDGENVVMENK